MNVERIRGLGTDVDISASTVFRGTSTALTLQTGSRLSIDETGVATLTRRWKCRRDLASGFLGRRGDIDFQYRNLRLIDSETSDEGAITTISDRYNGFIGGLAEPQVVERVNNAVKEVTLFNASGSLNLVYLSPKRTRIWSEDREPRLKDYYYAADFNNKPVKILFFKDQNGLELSGDGVTQELLNSFTFKLRSVRTQFDAPQDGFVYRVTEVVERQIVQEAAVNLVLIQNIL